MRGRGGRGHTHLHSTPRYHAHAEPTVLQDTPDAIHRYVAAYAKSVSRHLVLIVILMYRAKYNLCLRSTHKPRRSAPIFMSRLDSISRVVRIISRWYRGSKTPAHSRISTSQNPMIPGRFCSGRSQLVSDDGVHTLSAKRWTILICSGRGMAFA